MAGIKEAIQSLLTVCNTIDGIVYVRVWNNQLEYEQNGELYNYPKPAIFIEAQTPNQFMPLLGGFSQSDIFFIVHIVHEQFDAGDGTFDQNMDVFDLRSSIINKLNLFKPTNCNGLQKISEEQDFTHNNLYHYKITFLCGLIDDAGVKSETIKAPPTTLIVSGEVKDTISGEQNQNYREWPEV